MSQFRGLENVFTHMQNNSQHEPLPQIGSIHMNQQIQDQLFARQKAGELI